MSVKVVTNIAANLIAFLAVLDFINAALSWLGNMVDIRGLQFPGTVPLDLWRGWSWPVVTVGGHPQSPGQPSQQLLLPCASAHLLHHVLRPVAFLMDVAWEDCSVVAELLGMKLFLNEFVAYQGLSEPRSSAASRALRSGSAPKSSGSP